MKKYVLLLALISFTFLPLNASAEMDDVSNTSHPKEPNFFDSLGAVLIAPFEAVGRGIHRIGSGANDTWQSGSNAIDRSLFVVDQIIKVEDPFTKPKEENLGPLRKGLRNLNS